MKKLLLDYVYLGEFCNFRCSYCTSPKLPLPRGGEAVSRLKANLEKSLNSLRDSFVVYRFSGGEIFLFEEVLHWVLDQSFPVTQFLTNGTLLSDRLLQRLHEARDRVFVAVSLDGHTPAMNRMRGTATGINSAVLQRILKNLWSLGEAGVAVEIQTVLSGENADALPAFLDFLMDTFHSQPLMVSPFPVRPMEEPFSLKGIDEVLARWDRYRTVLPSKAYMEGLRDSLCSDRNERCAVPDFVSFLVLRDGLLEKGRSIRYFCECGGLARGYGKICRSCYTHYELFSSLAQGRTDLSEVPYGMFKNAKVKAYFEGLSRKDGQGPGTILSRAFRFFKG